MLIHKPLVRPAWLGLLISLMTVPSQAQISASQMAMFNQLSPAQQEAVAAQYGVDVQSLRNQSATRPETELAPTLSPRQLDTQQVSQRPAIPQKDPASQSLQPFGYNVFAAQPTSHSPLADIPVPDDYIVGPGDEIRVQLYGKENTGYQLKVNREGQVEFPKLGPIPVAGMSFQQVSETLKSRISEQFIGIESAVSFGSLRTMQIFVMGDAYQPGAYNVNALTTVTQALQVAGGIDTVGSLRKIQVKRGGQLVRTVDLYKLLIQGNTVDDIRLRAGDTLFIPAKGIEVAVSGLVRRPALYELTGHTSLEQTLSLAGGLKAEALHEIKVTRRSESGTKVFNLDLAKAADRQFMVRNGDQITAMPTTTEYAKAVAIKGAVVREGTHSYQPGMRLSQLLKDTGRDLKATADLDYALVVRELNHRRDIEVLQFNLGRAISQPGSMDDLPLQPRDQVLVFAREIQDGFGQRNVSTEEAIHKGQLSAAHENQITRDNATGATVTGAELEEASRLLSLNTATETSRTEHQTGALRASLLAPVIERLKQQASIQHPVQIVEVRGEVRYPGIYPLARQSTQADLLVAAGGLKESAGMAELSQVLLDNQGGLSLKVQKLALADLVAGRAPKAQSKDSLNILANPEWREQATVQLFGEVSYPGTYTIRRGETLHQLIQRAGGLTRYANPNGSVFAREALRKQEADRLVYLKEQLQQEISTLALRRQSSVAGTTPVSPSEAAALVSRLDNTQAIGRMTIDLPAILDGEAHADVTLEDGDKLYVPVLQNVISVAGQVQLPTSHQYDPSLDVADYIERSGGTKKQADTDRIYVIRANGSVMMPKSSYWFSRKDQRLQPGDTIIAPLDSDYIDNLTGWSTATQMLYQLGVAWKAVK